MKVPKSELNALLSPPGASESFSQSTAPDLVRDATPPGNRPSPGSAADAGAKKSEPDIRFELARALPSLWAKALREKAAGTATREKDKLRELLVWLLTKRSALVKQRHTLQFVHEGKSLSGRLDVVASVPGSCDLAIEIDWVYSRASIEKLQAAHRQGMRVMWVVGQPLLKQQAKGIRARANAEFGSTYGWLFLFHLEHGWL